MLLPKVVREALDECCYSHENDTYLDHANETHKFSIDDLAWAIQNGVGEEGIERYLAQHNEARVAVRLSQPVQVTPESPAFPILYFAAQRNSPRIIKVLCKAGAKPSQKIEYSCPTFGIPLLAYTILSAEYKFVDTTETLVALLAAGANPHDVPIDIWQDYLRSPTKDGPQQLGPSETKEAWCTTEAREALYRTANLLQRYSLWKAANIERPTVRELQMAKAHNILPLFETPYYIFGQQLATTQVLQRITNRFLFNSTKPLVLILTGLSGHGKTELARRMGDLLSLKLLIVDCTTMQHDTDLFGPWHPYYGSKDGSQLNNHLADWDGERTVVFLDEFDKTTDDVRQSMLLLFESGFYVDRRDKGKVDCSNVIWVLSSNLGVQEISRFWVEYLKDRSQEQQKEAPIKNLEVTLEKCMIDTFGAPLTGRFSAIVPFLPFNEGERAVVAYKFMRELWHEVRKPISVEEKRYAGNMFVNFVNDEQIAKYIAKRYLEETGARSLANAVEKEIYQSLAVEFLNQEGEVKDEMNRLPLRNYDVRVVGDSRGKSHIEVACRGSRGFQTSPNC